MTPTVWLIVDGSSSMNGEFAPGATRWQALRGTLMDPDGVVASLQSAIEFGMVIYSGGDANACVNLITVDPALNNHAALSARYPDSPLGPGTPTDKALEQVVMNLPVLNQAGSGTADNPIFVVLATDGTPTDSCIDDTDLPVEQRVVDGVSRGARAGMKMFVISLAGDTPALQTHLEQVAEATATGQPPYVPATRDDLVAAFQTIVAGGSCRVELNARVAKGLECIGSVTLNGEELECNGADGWQLTDEQTVELTGSACQRFLAKASQVSATFGCIIPQ